jgi:hypothetical protein
MGNVQEGIEIDYSQGVAVNCNFSGNQDGVDLSNSVFKARYCSFLNNTNRGAYADYACSVDASDCWWGNFTGPYHSSKNPTGTGDTISNYIYFEPWQTELYQHAVLMSDFRCMVDKLNWRVVYPDENTPKPLGCFAASVSDWLASAFITTKLPRYLEGLDTDPAFVDQVTGEQVGDPGTGVISFGGPIVNPIVKRAEDPGTPEADRAPVKFNNGGDTFYFQYANGTNVPGAELPLSVINNNEDMFLIETYIDGEGRVLILCYGFGWKGTYAAGKFIDTVIIPEIDFFNNKWIIVHWEDGNGDGFVNDPGEGDPYSVIQTGN